MKVMTLALAALAVGIFAAPVTSYARETATFGARTAYCCLKKPPTVKRGRWTKRCKLVRVATRAHNRANSSYWIVVTREYKRVCNWVQE